MATRIVRIEVTREDISDGIKGKCHLCPIALAVTRCLSVPGDLVFVERRIIGLPMCEAQSMPVSAVEFIKRFDVGLSVKPFAFDLEIPQVA